MRCEYAGDNALQTFQMHFNVTTMYYFENTKWLDA